jgi:hypothetical protein
MTYIIKNDSIIIVLAHSNNSPRVDMSLHSHTFSWFRANQSLLFPTNAAYSLKCSKRIDGVMVSVIISSTMDRRFEYTVQVKLKTIKLVNIWESKYLTHYEISELSSKYILPLSVRPTHHKI